MHERGLSLNPSLVPDLVLQRWKWQEGKQPENWDSSQTAGGLDALRYILGHF